MDAAAIARAAQILNDARQYAQPLAALPADCAPANLKDAYAIQSAVRASWPYPVAGWKIGATSPAIQAKFGVSEPIIGPFFAPDVYASPARPAAAQFAHLAIETEFAYRLGHDLPAREQTYTRLEILDAIDALVPAFEVVSPRFRELPFGNVAAAVADCSLNGAMVLGTPVTNWRGIDVPRHKVELSVDGEVKARGVGADAMEDPRNVLDWAVEKLRAGGLGLSAGMVISTGTCTGVVMVQPGQTVTGDFGSLGGVEVRFV